MGIWQLTFQGTVLGIKLPKAFTQVFYSQSVAERMFTMRAINIVTTIISIFFVRLASADSPMYSVQTLVSGLERPWSIAELPGGNAFLITEKNGRLLKLDEKGVLRNIAGTPNVYTARQGGLFDIVLHPEFEQNNRVFLSYASGNEKANRTTIGTAILSGNNLQDFKEIFRVVPDKKGGGHFGGKLLFDLSGNLLLSVGEGYAYREQAQSLDSQLGKLLRMTEHGQPLKSNPFPKKAPYVYSYGHRNPQGLIETLEGEIWMTEHGPKGGDELNQIGAGKNYGWPAITYGVDYSGAIISPFTEAEGMEQPIKYWVPSIATSGLARVPIDSDSPLAGHFLIGGLKAKKVIAVDARTNAMIETEPFPTITGRIRDIRVTRDGSILAITDEGTVYRAKKHGSG